ncbi:MAG: cytochrome c [Candidatus Thiodiazotropha sp. (ex Dulcina madagascariensis)]|nr:cytochrome c [Candidatus Thiodiazotropha sp. (ex Dulcina madagascariensis)]
MIRTTNATAACLLALTLAGCSDVNDYKPTADMTATDIFTEACSSCHGDGGSGKFGFLLKIAGTEAAAEEVVEKILHGGHIMPAFPNIDEQDAERLATYLKAQ